MRVLLQNAETKLYLVGVNQWTDDPAKATDFEDVENAAQAYHTQDVAYARIVVDPAATPTAAHPFTELLRQARPRV